MVDSLTYRPYYPYGEDSSMWFFVMGRIKGQGRVYLTAPVYPWYFAGVLGWGSWGFFFSIFSHKYHKYPLYVGFYMGVSP